MTKSLETYLKKITKELFSLSQMILPDDLQSQQIVVDAVCVYVIRKKNLIEKIATSCSGDETAILLFETRKYLYREIYKLAKKRQVQLGKSVNYEGDSDFAPFYLLDIIQRVVLFLKHKTNFELNDIADILDLKEMDVIVALQTARKKLIGNMGKNLETVL